LEKHHKVMKNKAQVFSLEHTLLQGHSSIRGQGAIEYLLIIGAAILVVAIVTLAITSLLGQGQTQTTSGANEQGSALGGLTSLAYVTVSGSNYQKSDPIVTSLKSMWTLNDASTITDSVGGINGTCGTACPTLINGISGNAFHFTSGNTAPEQYILIDNIPAPNEVTYSTWFRTSSTGYISSFRTYNDPISLDPDNPNHWRGSLSIDASNYLFWEVGSWTSAECPSNSLHLLKSKEPITFNEWHMATLTVDYNPFIGKFYLDGELQATHNDGKACSNNSNYLWLGRRKILGQGTPTNFIGDIDDFAIWDRQLTSDEIKTLYTNAKK
jgi:hypothetical protein